MTQPLLTPRAAVASAVQYQLSAALEVASYLERALQPSSCSIMDPDLLHCSVCLSGYNSSNKRPFDLGCGHSFCEQCIKSSPRSFRSCPECRTRASNPHANIALLRLLDSLGANSNAATAAGGAALICQIWCCRAAHVLHQRSVKVIGFLDVLQVLVIISMRASCHHRSVCCTVGRLWVPGSGATAVRVIAYLLAFRHEVNI